MSKQRFMTIAAGWGALLALALAVVRQDAAASEPRGLLSGGERSSFPGAMANPRDGITLPAPLPGQPSHLVRVIYLMPTDRTPADPSAYQAKVDLATTRIRTILEGIDDFYFSGQAQVGLTPRHVNFDRDATGQIRVLDVRGRLATQGSSGYWGDANGSLVYFTVRDDIFGGYDQSLQACAGTVYMIFPDVLQVDAAGYMKGYTGGGANFEVGPGSGGICMVSYGVLECILPASGPTAADRATALLNTFCSTDTNVSFFDHDGPLVGIPPCEWENKSLQRGQMASIYGGVTSHEFLHTQDLGHDYVEPYGVMNNWYPKFAGAVQDLHGAPHCSPVPIGTGLCSSTVVGEITASWINISPYFNDSTTTETVPPTTEVAWPPSGAFNVFTGGELYIYLRNKIRDSGSGPSFSMVYDGLWWTSGAHVTPGVDTTLYYRACPPGQGNFEGRGRFNVRAVDRSWNYSDTAFQIFNWSTGDRLHRHTNSVWVRRPAAEDPRWRTAACTTDSGGTGQGCFAHPYDSIAAALSAVSAVSPATIILGEGEWPMTSTLTLPAGLSLTGEGVGATILDGGGGNFPLVRCTSPSESAISNLVFRNAANAIVATSAQNFLVSNNIVQNMTSTGIAISLGLKGVEVSQNTVIDCAEGILLAGTAAAGAEGPLYRDNLVAYCTGKGLFLADVRGNVRDGRSGYNLAYSNGVDFFGTGATASYSGTRLAGEVSADPQFVAYPPSIPIDLTPRVGSAAAQGGHPDLGGVSGGPRAIGAWTAPPTSWSMAEIDDSITAADPVIPGSCISGSGQVRSCSNPGNPCVSGGAAGCHFKAYKYTNTSGADQCVTVTHYNLGDLGNTVAVAYLNCFNPGNGCANWVSDAGWGTAPHESRTFSFTVPNGSDYVVVVEEVSPNWGTNSYHLSIDAWGPRDVYPICGQAPTATPTAPPSPTASPTPSVSATPTPPGGSAAGWMVRY